ncbi:aromatic acid exporter family protein [Alteribacter natronophilus]|uniref:aromatic acid exporter family protein n=1 Tax=Alteribacter natronophilus TaxID=2583810 RepID=UPI00110F5C2A|nr:aromatic acid exporter family protein [Alteribacter natronophilus]TMW73724.1 aromatic acid exporter family protein [Alteribacter natronophilus]
MFRIGYRTLKTALGAALAIGIAQWLQLDFYASAGIITVLCIQKTKKKSFQTSWARFLACLIGLFFAAVLFEALGYNPLVLGLLLLLFIPVTLIVRAQAGIVTSLVVMLHLYTLEAVSVPIILNELILIVIGIGCALLMNIYMPSVETELAKDQQELEDRIRTILHEFAVYVRKGDSSWTGKEITEAAEIVDRGKNTALQNLENHVLRYEDLFYHYFKMREKQLDILERMMPLLTSVDTKVKQGEMVAVFLEKLSGAVHPENTAHMFIDELEELQASFREMPLPQSREEFETRSAILQLIKELEQYLIIKRHFKPKREYTMFR